MVGLARGFFLNTRFTSESLQTYRMKVSAGLSGLLKDDKHTLGDE